MSKLGVIWDAHLNMQQVSKQGEYDPSTVRGMSWSWRLEHRVLQELLPYWLLSNRDRTRTLAAKRKWVGRECPEKEVGPGRAVHSYNPSDSGG